MIPSQQLSLVAALLALSVLAAPASGDGSSNAPWSAHVAGSASAGQASTCGFTDASAGLTGVHQGSVAWADYDNDGDLDILLTGFTGATGLTGLYRNSGGPTPTFTDVGAGLTGVRSSSVAWGDYDNDGDLDLLLTGFDGTGPTTKLYRNSGGANPTFTDVGAGLTGVQVSSVAWGDYDNDGDIDILLTGSDASFAAITKLYRNSGGANPTFSDVGAALDNVQQSSVAWGDYDNDGDLDILLTGLTPGLGARSKLYRNSGGANPTFSDAAVGLTGVNLSSVAWADYDNDGDLDILLTGFTGSGRIARLYRNNGGANPTFTDVGAALDGVNASSVAWGDYDKDGDLDILLTGFTGSGRITRLYQSSGGATPTFSDAGAGLVNVQNSSVAWADYDVDGDLDILLTGYDPGNIPTSRLYRSDGCGTVPVVPGLFAGAFLCFDAGDVPSSVAVGDLNRDGKPDLAVVNHGVASVSVLLGNGDGSVGTKTDFTTGSGPYSVAIADVNRDGKLDLVTANYVANTVSVLLGSGTGTFGAKIDFATGTNPWSVAIGDVNRDGKPDLAVTNYNANTVSVLLGSGTGTFGAKTDFATGGQPFSVAIGDLNADGRADLVVANSTSTTVSVLLGDGTGTFGAKTDFATGNKPSSVAIGDFNGDGKPDLVTANNISNTVSVMLGNGSGAFGGKTDFGTASGPTSVAIGDLNGDGKPDLAVATEGTVMVSGATVSVLLGTGTGTFGSRIDVVTGGRPVSVAIGDLNRDGKPDLMTANDNSRSVSVLLGSGTGAFGQNIDVGTGPSPFSVVIRELNGDGKPDLVTANRGNNTVSVKLGNGDGTFGSPSSFVTGTDPFSLAAADLNGNATIDLATANASSNTVSVLLSTGTGTFVAKTDYATGDGPYSVATGDLNKDGNLDLVTANRNVHTVSVLLGSGTGTFGAHTDFVTGTDCWSLAVADLNADGNPDAVTANGGSNTVSVLLGNGTGALGSKTDFATGAYAAHVAIGDVNADGKPDLVTANQNSNTVSVLLGTGTGTFTAKADFATGVYPSQVAIGDVNGDAKLDLVTANQNSNTVSVLLGTGTGTFPTKLDFGTGNAPHAVAIGDLGRGRRDLVTANFRSNTVSVLLNLLPPLTAVPPPIVPAARLQLSIAPNPAGQTAWIEWVMPAAAGAKLEVFDVRGQRVACLLSGPVSAGRHRLPWDGRRNDGANVASGIYLVRLMTASGASAAPLVWITR